MTRYRVEGDVRQRMMGGVGRSIRHMNTTVL